MELEIKAQLSYLNKHVLSCLKCVTFFFSGCHSSKTQVVPLAPSLAA